MPARKARAIKLVQLNVEDIKTSKQNVYVSFSSAEIKVFCTKKDDKLFAKSVIMKSPHKQTISSFLRILFNRTFLVEIIQN